MREQGNHNFYTPGHWLLWLLFGLLYLVTRLPLSMQHWVGRRLGSLLYLFGRRRRHIAAVNLRLCFSGLQASQRHTLLKRHFALYGVSVIECFTAWWSKPEIINRHTEYTGLENFEQALAEKRGILLLSGHFTTLEIGSRLLGQKIPFSGMYRKHKNPLFERIMSEGRERWIAGRSYDRRDVRGILKSLKAGNAIWYGPDQDYGRKHSIFVPFMGVTAATVTGTSRWARLTNAIVLPYFVERTESGYHVRVFPRLENFPTSDQEADAIRINQIIEKQICVSPENYLWTHRRFKTRPAGELRPY